MTEWRVRTARGFVGRAPGAKRGGDRGVQPEAGRAGGRVKDDSAPRAGVPARGIPEARPLRDRGAPGSVARRFPLTRA